MLRSVQRYVLQCGMNILSAKGPRADVLRVAKKTLQLAETAIKLSQKWRGRKNASAAAPEVQ
eukprot:5847312-Lingulodinium_polyedra.AAC.1